LRAFRLSKLIFALAQRNDVALRYRSIDELRAAYDFVHRRSGKAAFLRGVRRLLAGALNAV